MWILYAFGSAIFAGITAILAKCGIKNTNSNVATAIRTGIILIFSWLIVYITGSFTDITNITRKTWIFLTLSGFATGASWLCYFKALQLGDINKVVPVDKSSIILTIIFAFLFLHEKITIVKCICIVAIAVGTYLMIQKRQTDQDIKEYSSNKKWLIYACLSAIFAALTAILGKIGISDVDSNLGTAIRTLVVRFMAWFIVFLTKEQKSIKQIPKSELRFICLSGLATGASWLCYYKALQSGPVSIVVPIDKLSILITIAFSYIVFKEKLSYKSTIGLLLITAGTITMIFL